jgi:hypothetical protein
VGHGSQCDVATLANHSDVPGICGGLLRYATDSLRVEALEEGNRVAMIGRTEEEAALVEQQVAGLSLQHRNRCMRY